MAFYPIFLSLLSAVTLWCAQPVYAEDDIAPEPTNEVRAVQSARSNEFMVTAAHPQAVEAGYKTLLFGGNAIDAAIAAQMVLNVVEPQSSGIGGGGFLVYYDAKTQKTYAYDGRETAPVAIDPNVFLNDQGKPRPFFDVVRGGASVGVPGLLRMLELAHAEFGKRPWAALFESAISIAEKGFLLSPRLHAQLLRAKELTQSEEARSMFFLDNRRVKAIGTKVNNPKLANLFGQIAEKGADYFYTGEQALNIVAAVTGTKENPGYMVLEDLRDYRAKRRPVLCNPYHHFRVCGIAPPSSGPFTVLQALGMLEKHDMSLYAPNHPQAIHIMTEALKRAFKARNEYIADPDFTTMPLKDLLDRLHLQRLGAEIDVQEQKPYYTIEQQEPPSTTHISIIDKEGNAVSMTTSIEYSFGSGVMVDGFLLNNQLTDFSFLSSNDRGLIANRVEPGKRPRSSMAPMMVFDQDNALSLVVGSPGGARIISYVLQMLVAHMDWQMPPGQAAALARFATVGKELEIEQGSALDAAVPRLQLEAMGHKLRVRDLNSGVHMIAVDGSRLLGAADPRREGTSKGR